MTKIKTLLKGLLPAPVLSWVRRQRVARLRARNQQLSTRRVFTGIYERNEWGGQPGEYCSGSGSREKYARAYGAMVRNFIKINSVQRLVDLGCGDFVIGSTLVSPGLTYVGVDIVDGLIARNQAQFGGAHVSFQCLDIVEDKLPDGDLCLVRQVLQHLSNSQITRVLGRLARYRYVMITEHYPSPAARVVPNRDKPAGGDTRLVDDSAVFLDLPPFNASVSRVMLEVVMEEFVIREGEVLRTLLLEHPPNDTSA